MSNQLVPVNDIERMANAVAKSGLFGVKTPDQAMALMLIAQAEGLHPAIAARDYHVINGKPSLKADAMLARFQQAGGKIEWKVYTDTEVTGIFSHPQGGKVEISWTMEMAKKAKLDGKDTWKSYPRQMLRARVISEGIRTVYPGVSVGIYTPEEVQDFDDKPAVVIENDAAGQPDAPKPVPVFRNASLRNQFHKNVKESLREAQTVESLNELIALNKEKFDAMRASGHDADAVSVDDLQQTYRIRLGELKAEGAPGEDSEAYEDALRTGNAPDFGEAPSPTAMQDKGEPSEVMPVFLGKGQFRRVGNGE